MGVYTSAYFSRLTDAGATQQPISSRHTGNTVLTSSRQNKHTHSALQYCSSPKSGIWYITSHQWVLGTGNSSLPPATLLLERKTHSCIENKEGKEMHHQHAASWLTQKKAAPRSTPTPWQHLEFWLGPNAMCACIWKYLLSCNNSGGREMLAEKTQ